MKTDESLMGWGALCDGESVKGLWTQANLDVPPGAQNFHVGSEVPSLITHSSSPRCYEPAVQRQSIHHGLEDVQIIKDRFRTVEVDLFTSEVNAHCLLCFSI